MSQDCWGAMAVLRGRCWLRVGSALPPWFSQRSTMPRVMEVTRMARRSRRSLGLNDRAFAGRYFPNLTDHAGAFTVSPPRKRRQCRDFRRSYSLQRADRWPHDARCFDLLY